MALVRPINDKHLLTLQRSAVSIIMALSVVEVRLSLHHPAFSIYPGAPVPSHTAHALEAPRQ